MLEVLLASSGNGSNSLILQSQFVLGGSPKPQEGAASAGPEGLLGRERIWSSPSIPSPPSAKFRLPAHFWPQTKSSRWGSQPKTLALCPKERLFGRKQIPLFKISFKNAICSKILPGKVFWAAWPRSLLQVVAGATCPRLLLRVSLGCRH